MQSVIFMTCEVWYPKKSQYQKEIWNKNHIQKQNPNTQKVKKNAIY